MIHTVSGLIPLFDWPAKQHLPGWQAFNMLDESLLRGAIREGALSQTTMWRLAQMARSAVDAAKPFCPVSLFRIDEGMAQAAVTIGPRIGVLATLRTALDPTSDLIRRSVAQAGRPRTVLT